MIAELIEVAIDGRGCPKHGRGRPREDASLAAESETGIARGRRGIGAHVVDSRGEDELPRAVVEEERRFIALEQLVEAVFDGFARGVAIGRGSAAVRVVDDAPGKGHNHVQGLTSLVLRPCGPDNRGESVGPPFGIRTRPLLPETAHLRVTD